MITYRCTCCGSVVFFENVRCGSCGSPLGFVPAEQRLAAFSVDGTGRWHRIGEVQGADHTSWHPCANYVPEAVCNWMVPATDHEALCESCRYTEVIPALADPRNRTYWYRLELAKRRLLVSLRALGLSVPSRREDPANGLAFHFVAGGAALGRVVTGHASGIVTMNISEADDVTREHQRTHMGEPYRTLLGHFRHEAGHFYWPRLVGPTRWLQAFRALFGDEQQPYDDALSAHYRWGPPADWAQRHVSAYASCHPWEDWAETWAHYLHIVDAMETAAHWGAAMGIGTGDAGPASRTVFADAGGDFAARLESRWLPLAQFVNSMNRSLGHGDSYPFVLPHPVVEKLAFVDQVIRSSVAACRLRGPHRPRFPVTYGCSPSPRSPTDATRSAASGQATASTAHRETPMVEQQMILTVALAGVATACTDIPATQRPTLRHPDFKSPAATQARIDDADTQAIWHRILQRSTAAA